MKVPRDTTANSVANSYPTVLQAPICSVRDLAHQIARVPLDYLTTSFLFLALPCLARLRGIPLNYDWKGFYIPYLIGVALHSIGFAAILHCIQYGFKSPMKYVLTPFLKRKGRPLFLILLFVESLWVLGLWKSLVIFLDFLTVLGYLEYLKVDRKSPVSSTLIPLIPVAYFSLGFILIASYNVLIGSARYFASYDGFFDAVDRLLLGGWSLVDLFGFLNSHLPLVAFKVLEKIYFFMFAQLGATMILLTIYDGPKRALRFVGTLTLAYQTATLIYFVLPSLGPFFLAHAKSHSLSPNLVTTQIQVGLINKLNALWSSKTQTNIGLDFYIAFPCMHLAQPLIVLWFLKSMKSVVRFLVAYDTLMVFAIVFLQWHYLADLFGGLAVAAAALIVHIRYSRVSSDSYDKFLHQTHD